VLEKKESSKETEQRLYISTSAGDTVNPAIPSVLQRHLEVTYLLSARPARLGLVACHVKRKRPTSSLAHALCRFIYKRMCILEFAYRMSTQRYP
jgi:hypothetical protein